MRKKLYQTLMMGCRNRIASSNERCGTGRDLMSSRDVSGQRRWSVAVATLVVMALCIPGIASAQQGEARTDDPGVVEDIEDIDESADADEVDRQAIIDAEEEGRVISPENLNPHERYNLPPNFDPGFQPRETPGDTRVTIDFRDAELDEVVRFFSGVMNINFIVADSLQADRSITIISPQEVTIDEAYRAFMSALEMNGLTIVPHGQFLKIMESDQAISEPLVPYEVDDEIPAESRMVTGIIPIENAEVETIEDVISNFTSDSATIIRYHSSLIINENAANLSRLRAMIQRLDEGGTSSNLYVHQVRYANAPEIEEQLREIFGADEEESEELSARERRRRARRDDDTEATDEDVDDTRVHIERMISDERTNQLIIVANEQSFQRISEMIEILDVETAVGGEVHVKFLEYANAEELSNTLSNLETGGGQADDDGSPVASLLQGEVQITAHDPSNALVVIASPRDFMALESVINELDRPRRQVYVEAVIMEIGLDVNRRLDLGATSGFSSDLGFLIPDGAVEDGLVDSTRGTGFGSANFPGLDGLEMSEGLGLGLLGPSVQLPGTEISLPAVALMLQATQTDDSVNVLSTPSILTMDNEEAEIIVGERVPIAQGIPAGGGGGGIGDLLGLGALGGSLGGGGLDQLQQGQQVGAGATQGNQQGNQLGGGALGGLGGGLGGLLGGGLTTPVSYEDVGIELRIVPQINESDYVRLEVDQEISDLAGSGAYPTRTRRNAQTTVLVRDQSTIVIGGLMRDQERETIDKVPFLGDVPVLGMLFRNRSVTTQKQNLVLMLTPYIVQDERDLQSIYDRKMEERREVMELFARQDREYHRHVDYQKKTGLLARMRNEIGEAEMEEEARRDALEEFEEDGPRYRILGSDPPGDGGGGQEPIEEPDDGVPDDIEVDVQQEDDDTTQQEDE